MQHVGGRRCFASDVSGRPLIDCPPCPSQKASICGQTAVMPPALPPSPIPVQLKARQGSVQPIWQFAGPSGTFRKCQNNPTMRLADASSPSERTVRWRDNCHHSRVQSAARSSTVSSPAVAASKGAGGFSTITTASDALSVLSALPLPFPLLFSAASADRAVLRRGLRAGRRATVVSSSDSGASDGPLPRLVLRGCRGFAAS